VSGQELPRRGERVLRGHRSGQSGSLSGILKHSHSTVAPIGTSRNAYVQ
jgi:hypothetical protein